MISCKAIPFLLSYLCLSPIAWPQKASPSPSAIPSDDTVDHTQDFREIVVPITSLKITPNIKLGITGKLGPKLDIGANFGTGFCLDAACHFIVTNYHVAMGTRTKKIEGTKIIRRYLATGPNDPGATLNILPNGEFLPYATSRDLAIFELQRSLPDHHGLTFSLDELEVGQEVDIYGYPKGPINPSRKLTRFPATFKAPTTSGFLAFDYQLSGDKPIRIRGASGGIVIDRKTEKIVGIMTETNETTALAVPVHNLVDFVNRVQPSLARRVFPPPISPFSADIYPKFAPRPDHYPKFVPVRVEGLQHRPEEPAEVKLLRNKAQVLADSIRNFIAVQTTEWGSGDKEPSAHAEYELRVIDGVQRFREYPDGKNELAKEPHPRVNSYVLGSDEWSTLPRMVGNEFRLKVQQAPDVVVHERRIKVFQYYASIEDNLCPFEPSEDFGFFTIDKVVPVACYGEVWTDEDTNILRISENLELSDKLKAYRGWENYQIVLTYDWLKRGNDPPRLVPLTFFVQGRNKKVYWRRGQFTDYRVFDSRVKLIAGHPARTPDASVKAADAKEN
jgi:Trypsin-like peptidase domain